MNPKLIAVFSSLLIMFVIGGLLYFGDRVKAAKEGEDESIHLTVKKSQEEKKVLEESPIEELNELAKKISSDIRAEMRLNLNMMAQLRTYKEMLKQVQGYAAQVERDIDIIKEISQDQFQEDVKLQASLFSGKRSETVAKHLEEFRSSRVGAILAKMKEKEASAVLDIWARDNNPQISVFYRQVMAAYLNNRRRDARPELFNKLQSKAEPSS